MGCDEGTDVDLPVGLCVTGLSDIQPASCVGPTVGNWGCEEIGFREGWPDGREKGCMDG